MKFTEGMLFTDHYQLTMAHMYYRHGIHEKNSQFDHFFRKYPNYGNHKAGYCINAGHENLLKWIQDAHFSDEDIDFLKNQTGAGGSRLFEDDFLQWLRTKGGFEALEIDAIPEGRVVHPNVPVTVVRGPLAIAQILESSLLNMLNYQTLIATKASRIRVAGRGKLLLEFGMRRGPERGVNAGIRGALIGGADYTSTVSVSRDMGLPPKGTHAHSMVQVFMAIAGGELEAFRAFAEVYPDDCVLLVDTINTLESGIPNAIKVFEELKKRGHKPLGIRLDSGDLAYMSIQAAKMLNDAGFPDTMIVLSNQLDELVIWQIITQIEEEAARYGVDPDDLINRLVYGVGTSLISSKGESALDGVYKLVAVQNEGEWIPAMKLSETPEKTVNPGNKKVFRLYDTRGNATADMLTLSDPEISQQDDTLLRHPTDSTKFRKVTSKDISRMEGLLKRIYTNGRIAGALPELEQIRETRERDIEKLDSGVKRIINPHLYHVSLGEDLWELKQELIRSTKQNA